MPVLLTFMAILWTLYLNISCDDTILKKITKKVAKNFSHLLRRSIERSESSERSN